MAKKCPECQEAGGRVHLPWCSYAPGVEDREAFIREHAVEIVRQYETKVRRQAEQLDRQGKKIAGIRLHLRQIQRIADERAEQIEWLSTRLAEEVSSDEER